MTIKQDLANTPIYPTVENGYTVRSGITLRQHYAGLAMQGYCANPHDSVNDKSFQELSTWSVAQADALIAELSK